MKKVVMMLLIISMVASLNGQEGKRFEYSSTNRGSYFVYPTFDKTKAEGNFGQSTVTDLKYVLDLFYSTIKDILPKQKLEKLHLSSGLIVTFNTSGEILYCKFIIDNNDINVLTDEELYKLYISIKKLEIDMTRVKIDNGGYQSNEKSLDYSEMVFSLVPIEYRNLNHRK